MGAFEENPLPEEAEARLRAAAQEVEREGLPMYCCFTFDEHGEGAPVKTFLTLEECLIDFKKAHAHVLEVQNSEFTGAAVVQMARLPTDVAEKVNVIESQARVARRNGSNGP